MTRVGGNELRDPGANEEIPLFGDVAGEGFELRLRSSKIYRPSGSPVYLLDVFSDANERIGFASLILEKDVEKVAGVGHVCASLVPTAFEGLLQRVAASLVSYAQAKGVERVRIVVAAEDKQSMHASDAIGPSSKNQLTADDGRQLVVFEYW